MDTELIPKHNNPIGHSLPYPYYCGGISERLYGCFFLENRPEMQHKNLLSVHSGCYG